LLFTTAFLKESIKNLCEHYSDPQPRSTLSLNNSLLYSSNYMKITAYRYHVFLAVVEIQKQGYRTPEKRRGWITRAQVARWSL